MSNTVQKPESMKLKLSFKKETLRVIDDSQLDQLEEVVGGEGSKLGCICGSTGCNTTQRTKAEF